MTPPDNWCESSCSGAGDGTSYVATATAHPRAAVRGSGNPARAALTFPAAAFTTFVDAPKRPHSTVTDFARLRG